METTVLDAPERATVNHKSETELLAPRVAAVKLRRAFEALAAVLERKDRQLREDMVQEMALAVLQYHEPREEAFFLAHAGWRARDYQRAWYAGCVRPGVLRHLRSVDYCGMQGTV